MSNDEQKRIEENLRAGLEAARKSPAELRKQASAMFPAKPAGEDRPQFWHEGEPQPDWASEANPPATAED